MVKTIKLHTENKKSYYRAKLIAQLKAKILSGKYRVSSEELARAVLNHCLAA